MMEAVKSIDNSIPIKEEDDLPPIRFINFKDFKELKSFPRYPDNANICVNEEDINRSISLIIFISHCWLRGWDGASGWDGRAHPDNANHDKFALILEAIDKYLIKQAPGMKEVYVWTDYGCINQNADPAGELKQLDKIVQACDLLLTVIADSYDNEWKSWDLPPTMSNWLTTYKAKAWSDGPYAYLNRCWCRVEMMYAANVPLSDDTVDRSKNFTAGLLQAVKANRRPHYLYGTRENLCSGAPIALEPLRNTFFEDYNPITGSITKETDRDKIKELIDALQPYISANKAIEGYVGERNATGKMHGLGIETYYDGSVYNGEFKNGLNHGYGVYTTAGGDVYAGKWKNGNLNGPGTCTFAGGDVYEGDFKDNIIDGYGVYKYSNGGLYTGMYKNGKKNGYGTLKYADGRVLEGTFKNGEFVGSDQSLCLCVCS